MSKSTRARFQRHSLVALSQPCAPPATVESLIIVEVNEHAGAGGATITRGAWCSTAEMAARSSSSRLGRAGEEARVWQADGGRVTNPRACGVCQAPLESASDSSYLGQHSPNCVFQAGKLE